MTREEKTDTVVRLFSQAMFYGDWECETATECLIEEIMRDLEYWPYESEADMIEKSAVDENLFNKD